MTSLQIYLSNFQPVSTETVTDLHPGWTALLRENKPSEAPPKRRDAAAQSAHVGPEYGQRPAAPDRVTRQASYALPGGTGPLQEQ